MEKEGIPTKTVESPSGVPDRGAAAEPAAVAPPQNPKGRSTQQAGSSIAYPKDPVFYAKMVKFIKKVPPGKTTVEVLAGLKAERLGKGKPKPKAPLQPPAPQPVADTIAAHPATEGQAGTQVTRPETDEGAKIDEGSPLRTDEA